MPDLPGCATTYQPLHSMIYDMNEGKVNEVNQTKNKMTAG